MKWHCLRNDRLHSSRHRKRRDSSSTTAESTNCGISTLFSGRIADLPHEVAGVPAQQTHAHPKLSPISRLATSATFEHAPRNVVSCLHVLTWRYDASCPWICDPNHALQYPRTSHTRTNRGTSPKRLEIKDL